MITSHPQRIQRATISLLSTITLRNTVVHPATLRTPPQATTLTTSLTSPGRIRTTSAALTAAPSTAPVICTTSTAQPRRLVAMTRFISQANLFLLTTTNPKFLPSNQLSQLPFLTSMPTSLLIDLSHEEITAYQPQHTSRLTTTLPHTQPLHTRAMPSRAATTPRASTSLFHPSRTTPTARGITTGISLPPTSYRS